MLWIFARGNEMRKFETRYDNETAEYVLVMHEPGAGQHVERFRDAPAFQSRLQALEQQLTAEQWLAVGPPALLRDGWRI